MLDDSRKVNFTIGDPSHRFGEFLEHLRGRPRKARDELRVLAERGSREVVGREKQELRIVDERLAEP